MGTEREQGCVGQRDELTRLMCEAAEPSRALRAHLAECGACRETLAANRRLADALRTALQPEPLPAALAARIRGAVDEQACEAEAHKAGLCEAELGTTGARAWVWPWRIATGAAAAGLAAAIPAVVFYNYFQNSIKAMAIEMDSFASEMLNILERHYSARR
jgi:hypothetical protein